jgi:hypothetical protein
MLPAKQMNNKYMCHPGESRDLMPDGFPDRHSRHRQPEIPASAGMTDLYGVPLLLPPAF